MPEEFKPLFDRVLVKEIEQPQLRKSGLALPDTIRERQRPPQEGIILAVGPGLDWWEGSGVEMPVAAGDYIMFPYTSGVPVQINEENLLVMRVGEILGVVERP